MERDMGPSVDQYLTYIPTRVTKEEYFASGANTTMPAYPRDVEVYQICTWEDFPSAVIRRRKRALKRALKHPSEKVLLPLIESHQEVEPCGNEGQVETMLYERLFLPLRRLMGYLDCPGKFVSKPNDAVLNLDFGWSSRSSQISGKNVLKIAIEVKTFWALDLAHDDLVAVIKHGKNKRRKLRRAISQIYGYMSVNHLRYGVIATYEKFIFLRRSHGIDDTDIKLEITKVIKRDQTRGIHGFTLMEAWVGLIKEAERDHVFTSPYPTPEKPGPWEFAIKEPMQLVQTAKIGNLYFGDRRIRSQLGVIVNGGIRGNHEKSSVMKVVDASKSPDNADKLDLEVSAYRELKALQERIVPKVRGILLIGGWIKVLVLSDCGERISKELFVEKYRVIRGMVKEIHSAGVAHGDLAYRNILVDTNMKITIIDFSEAKLQKKCTEEPFDISCRKDLIALKDLRNEGDSLGVQDKKRKR